MQRRLFGTDGIRGTSNTYPMTTEVALGLGRAAGSLFRRSDHQNRVVIGKDTRLSGYMIEYALTAGFLSAGMRVMLTGPVPTPAVAFLTRSLRADIGVMVSASHNPFEDNGIKLFGPDGFKLSDAIEAEIEAQMADMATNGEAPAAEIGRAIRYEDARGRYVENLKSSFPRGLDLAGRKIVVDCANGAAYNIAPELFFELGAEVISMGVTPNGRNINTACGSTYPAAIQEAVRVNGADLGIALDGDADRVVLVDEQGELVDGDQVLALIARSWAHDGRLTGGGIVATLMSNFGLESFMRSLGLDLHRTKVGDRYVVERMRAGGFNVGGEQSGHVVLTDFATTGDGLLAALQVLAVLCQNDRPVSEICRAFNPLPQVLKNIRIAGAIDLAGPDLAGVLSANTERLKGRGRLVVRPSGTEPLIRVMVEADDEHLLEDVLATVSAAIERETEAA